MKIITPPKNHFYITITDYYLRICNGNECAAALLRLYEHRHAQIITDLGNSGRKRFDIAELQQESSGAFLVKCLLGIYSINTVNKANKLLKSLDFIRLFSNFSDGAKLPNTVIFMPANVQAAVDLGVSNLSKGSAKISKGLRTIEQGGCADLRIELVLEQSIEKRESENFFDFDFSKIPTLEQVQQYATQTNQDPQKATDFFNTQTANNWLHNGKPINNWQSFFDGYKKRVFNGSVRTETPAKPNIPSIPEGEYF